MFHYGPYFFHRAFLRGSSPIGLFRSCLLLASPPVQPTAAMKIDIFNVNSLRKRLPIVLDWLAQQNPDMLGLQETKVQDSEFPLLALARSGHDITYRGMMPYNGVAILSREKPETVASGFDDGGESEDARLLRVVIDHHLIGILCPIFLIPPSVPFGERVIDVGAIGEEIPKHPVTFAHHACCVVFFDRPLFRCRANGDYRRGSCPAILHSDSNSTSLPEKEAAPCSSTRGLRSGPIYGYLLGCR